MILYLNTREKLRNRTNRGIVSSVINKDDLKIAEQQKCPFLKEVQSPQVIKQVAIKEDIIEGDEIFFEMNF